MKGRALVSRNLPGILGPADRVCLRMGLAQRPHCVSSCHHLGLLTDPACLGDVMLAQVLKEGSDKKKAGHIEALKREINVLTKLKGSLNIIKLEVRFLASSGPVGMQLQHQL